MAHRDENDEIIPHGANLRQLKFAEAYHASGKARESARAAGYRGSDRVLSVQASKLLANDKVLALLTDMKASEVLENRSGILTDEQMLEILSKEARTAKSDQARVNAVATLHKLKEMKTEREQDSSEESVMSAIVRFPPELRWLFAQHLGLTDQLRCKEESLGLPVSRPVKVVYADDLEPQAVDHPEGSAAGFGTPHAKANGAAGASHGA